MDRTFAVASAALAALSLGACVPDNASKPPTAVLTVDNVAKVAAGPAPLAAFTGKGKEFCYFWGHVPGSTIDRNRIAGRASFQNGLLVELMNAHGYYEEKDPAAAYRAGKMEAVRLDSTQQSAAENEVRILIAPNTYHFKIGSVAFLDEIPSTPRGAPGRSSCASNDAEAAAGLPAHDPNSNDFALMQQ